MIVEQYYISCNFDISLKNKKDIIPIDHKIIALCMYVFFLFLSIYILQ